MPLSIPPQQCRLEELPHALHALSPPKRRQAKQKRRQRSKHRPRKWPRRRLSKSRAVSARSARTQTRVASHTVLLCAALVRRKSDPSLRDVGKTAKSTAPEWPAEQDDYATAYGAAPAGQVKLLSWNTNSFNACFNKGGLDVLLKDAPDIVCVQETKVNEADIAKFEKRLNGEYAHCYWSCCSVKKGYAGTAVFSKIKPLSGECLFVFFCSRCDCVSAQKSLSTL